MNHDVEEDVRLLRQLYERTEPLFNDDAKLARLKELLAGELRGRKVLIFSSYKDTSRYLFSELTADRGKTWRKGAGNPAIRRIRQRQSSRRARPHSWAVRAGGERDKPSP